MMKILAIPGSVRHGSYNLALLNSALKLSPNNIDITVYDKIQDIPIFNPDIDDKDIPGSVINLMSELRVSDGVIISTPEYAHGIPGVLKNTLDWLVATDALVLKPVLVTSVSTSGLGGVRSHAPLVLVLSAMNSNVVIDGSLNVAFAHGKFDENGNLTDSLTGKALKNSLLFLEHAVNNCS